MDLETLDTLLVDLAARRDRRLQVADDLRRQADEIQHEADMIEAEIGGIKKARAILAPPAGNSAEPPKKERRDITALVRDQRAGFPLLSAAQIAQQINCRVSQVEKALTRLGLPFHVHEEVAK